MNCHNESLVQHLFLGLLMEIRKEDFGPRIIWSDEQRDIGDVCQGGYEEKKT